MQSQGTETPAHLLGMGTGQLGFALNLRSRFDLPESVFVDMLNREGLRHLRFARFAVDDRGTVEQRLGDEVLISRRTEASTCAVQRIEQDALAFIELSRGSVTIEIAGRERSALAMHCQAVATRLGVEEREDGDVPVTFWALGAHGARSVRRRIKAPDWSEVAANYEQTARLGVEKLITSRTPTGGRLILWHGEPGTGKTNALRALARVWSDWCATHFITDPEAFLGAGTSYLLDVLTAEAVAAEKRAAEWRMVVLEDSGELLTADAHERTGQALSRLLNITDGLIGQGMQVIVLVTTNEPLRRLHPAIQREGRCWKEVEFLPLSPQEANLWLAAHDCATSVTVPTVIADLYAILRGRSPLTPRAFGFGAA